MSFDNTEMPDEHRDHLNELLYEVENRFGDPDNDLESRIWHEYCEETLSFALDQDIMNFTPTNQLNRNKQEVKP